MRISQLKPVKACFIFKKQLRLKHQTRPSTRFVKKCLVRNLTVVEIGVRRGYNALNMYKQLDIKKMYLVDPYCSYPNPDGRILDFSSSEAVAQKLVGNKPSVVFMKETSDVASLHIPDNLDFVYIDGDHSYNAVKRDLFYWYPKVREGGILAGHDFNARHKEVCQAVTELVDEKGIFLHREDPDWWLVK